MTITNDERREIAAMLREDIGLHTFAEIFGFSWTDERDWYWRDVTAKVADYVEPEPERTCKRIEKDNPADNECSECGFYLMYMYSYCPNCGARIKENTDA